MIKNLPANAGVTGDMSSIFRSGRSLGERNSNPFQYSFHRQSSLVGYSPWVTKSRTLLSPRAHTHTHTHENMFIATKSYINGIELIAI